jgi:hypothetical protein
MSYHGLDRYGIFLSARCPVPLYDATLQEHPALVVSPYCHITSFCPKCQVVLEPTSPLSLLLSVRWCSISDPSESPSALECETHPPSPWGSGRDAFAHSSPAYAGERLRHSRWFPGAYAMLPSGIPSRPNTAMDGFGQQAVKRLPHYQDLE